MHGADPLATVNIFQDPRYRELAEEILRLSTRFGILSEYTSFLATEGTRLDDWGLLNDLCNVELEKRAVFERFGENAVNQGRNFNWRKQSAQLNPGNGFWDENSNMVAFTTVQQIGDRAYFNQNGQWVDSLLITAGGNLEATEECTFGSE